MYSGVTLCAAGRTHRTSKSDTPSLAATHSEILSGAVIGYAEAEKGTEVNPYRPPSPTSKFLLSTTLCYIVVILLPSPVVALLLHETLNRWELALENKS
ncbi:hypothetical protein QVD17_41705 [Tagetes erecta]|uniref:Uncharacterized protein n=1 Tax=Tagetes erecta TaxID=13708 RepID=A0AAD8JN63_TARER|nr:hypothetical protein QVD17_41705 [Tagetes erecta]